MTLNKYKNKAKLFLKKINKETESIDEVISLLEKEIKELKKSKSDINQFNHKIYDCLFILFEIASKTNAKLDSEWEKGWQRKTLKYFTK